MNKVVVFNKLLRLNVILLQILIILCTCEFHDVLFHFNNNQVRINFKGNNISYIIYEKSFNTKYECLFITLQQYQKIIHDLQLATNLNIFEHISQSSSFKIKFNAKLYNIRVSLHPTNNNIYALSLRLINNHLQHINIQLKHGLILIGGRTCSGKTSLMYNILHTLSQKYTVITLEDPIERELSNVIQTDVRYIGYDEGIRSILRQNPDWICIGEIRDAISAAAVIRAAMTGHNVIATIHIHTNDLQSIINRFEEMNCKYLLTVLQQFIYCYRNNDDFNYIDYDNIGIQPNNYIT